MTEWLNEHQSIYFNFVAMVGHFKILITEWLFHKKNKNYLSLLSDFFR